MQSVTRFSMLALLVSLFLALTALGSVYRVGTDEKYTSVCEAASELKAGGIIDVTGDITDNVIQSASGTEENKGRLSCAASPAWKAVESSKIPFFVRTVSEDSKQRRRRSMP